MPYISRCLLTRPEKQQMRFYFARQLFELSFSTVYGYGFICLLRRDKQRLCLYVWHWDPCSLFAPLQFTLMILFGFFLFVRVRYDRSLSHTHTRFLFVSLDFLSLPYWMKCSLIFCCFCAVNAVKSCSSYVFFSVPCTVYNVRNLSFFVNILKSLEAKSFPVCQSDRTRSFCWIIPFERKEMNNACR